MRYIDQFDDPGLSLFRGMLEKSARDKVASTGQVRLSSYRYGAVHPGVLVAELLEHTKIAAASDPTLTRIAVIGIPADGGDGQDLPEDRLLRSFLGAHLSDSTSLFKDLGMLPSHPYFRAGLSGTGTCVMKDTGQFPMCSPMQALLSFMYASAQPMPDELYSSFDAPMSEIFGPRSYSRIKKVMLENPIIQLLNDANIVPDSKPVDDGMPRVHTFLPRLIFELMKLNNALKGGIDPLLADVSAKLKKEHYIVLSDRDFQKKLLSGLETMAGRDAVRSHTGRFPEELIFNTGLDMEAPGILKVRNMLIDKSRLETLPYRDGAASFSPQVADAIYNKEKTAIDFQALADLIERLEDLEVEADERKEIDDRVLKPLKLFLEPDDSVVDKIMTLR